MELQKLLKEFRNCECGQKHECNVKDICVGSGLVHEVGNILKRNNFPRKLLLVADKTTLAVSEGILDSLKDFDVTLKIYDTLRVATMDDVRSVEAYFGQGIEGVLSVGTGSLNDTCRLACAHGNKPFCIFATAPSMDGFASDSAPIVDNNFKFSYAAKSPDVIIGDTKILAAAPAELKSAGFGDMVAKYVALIDWEISHIISGESYCEKVAALTRYAVDGVTAMADKVTLCDEETAKSIFEGLLLTGIAMGFTKTSRPASGTEHIMAHYIECRELFDNKIPNYHGEDVGVCTLIILRYYAHIAEATKIHAHAEHVDWDDVYATYGGLAGDVRKLNTPYTITDGIDPEIIERNFDKIRDIIKSVPSYEEVLAKMKPAGCKTTIAEIGKTQELIDETFKYHPYMRRRLSLRRLANMFDAVKL